MVTNQPETDTRPAERISICVFAIDRLLIGLRLGEIDRVLAAMELKRLELMPPYIAGILNLRGMLIPVIDMRTLLGLSTKPLTADDCIVLGHAWGKAIAFVVDAVLGVQECDVMQTMAPALQPIGVKSPVDGFVLHGREVIMIQELEKFLTAEVAACLKTMEAAGTLEKTIP